MFFFHYLTIWILNPIVGTFASFSSKVILLPLISPVGNHKIEWIRYVFCCKCETKVGQFPMILIVDKFFPIWLTIACYENHIGITAQIWAK